MQVNSGTMKTTCKREGSSKKEENPSLLLSYLRISKWWPQFHISQRWQKSLKMLRPSEDCYLQDSVFIKSVTRFSLGSRLTILVQETATEELPRTGLTKVNPIPHSTSKVFLLVVVGSVLLSSYIQDHGGKKPCPSASWHESWKQTWYRREGAQLAARALIPTSISSCIKLSESSQDLEWQVPHL